MLWSRVTIVFNNKVLLILPKGSPDVVLSSVVGSPQTQESKPNINSQDIIKLITSSNPPHHVLKTCVSGIAAFKRVACSSMSLQWSHYRAFLLGSYESMLTQRGLLQEA